MLSNFKNTFKHTFVYSIGNLSIKAIGLVLLPIYTSQLTTNDYGILALLEITALIMVSVLSFKLSTALIRWFSEVNTAKERKTLVFTNYVFSLAIVLLINVVLHPFSGDISFALTGFSGMNEIIHILIVSVSFEILNFYPLEIIRYKEKSILYAIIVFVRLTIILSLNILFVVKLQLGIKGVILSQLAGQALVFVFTLPLVIKNIVIKINLGVLKEMLKYSSPLVFSTISMMLLTMGDRYIIKYLLNATEVGLYSLGYKLSSVLNMFIIQSFQMGFLPIAYKMYNKPEANRFFSKTLTYYTIILVIVGLLISLFSKEIIYLFSRNEAYYPAYKVIPFIVLSFILKGIQYVFSLGLHYVKKTRFNASIVGCIALINVALNFALIPLLGIIGASVSTVLCWLLMAVLFYWYANKLFPINYEIKKLLVLVFIYMIITVFGNYLLPDMKMYLAISLKIIPLILIPFVLYWLKFYEAIEIERIKGFVRKWDKTNVLSKRLK